MPETTPEQPHLVTTTRRGALKLKDAADYLSVSQITLRRLIARSLIKPSRVLRHIIVPVAELDRFLSEN